MISETDIRSHVARYLAGEMDLNQLDRSLGPIRFEPDDQLDEAAEALLSQIEGRLAEYEHGDWTEPELAEMLFPLGPAIVIETQASTSSEVIGFGRTASDSKVLTLTV